MGTRSGYLSDANVKAHCPERFRPNFGQAYALFGMSNGRPAQVPSSVTFYLKKQSKQTGVPYETLSKLYAESVKRVAPEILIPVPSTLQNFSSVRIRNQVASIAIRPQPLLVSTRIPAVEADIGLAFERERLRLEGEQLNRRATEFLSELDAEDATPDLFTQVPSDTSDERSEEGVARVRDLQAEAETLGAPSLSSGLQPLIAINPDLEVARRVVAKRVLEKREQRLARLRRAEQGERDSAKRREESSGLQPLIAINPDLEVARRVVAKRVLEKREQRLARAKIEIERAKFEERERMGQASGRRTPPTSDSFLMRGQDRRLRHGLAYAQATETEARRNAPY